MKVLLVQSSSWFPTLEYPQRSYRALMESLAENKHECKVIICAADTDRSQSYDESLSQLASLSISPNRSIDGVTVFSHNQVQVCIIKANIHLDSYLLRQ